MGGTKARSEIPRCCGNINLNTYETFLCPFFVRTHPSFVHTCHMYKKHTQNKSTYAFLPRCHIPKYMGRNSSLSRQKKGGATVCNWLSRRGGVQLVVRGPQGPGYTTPSPFAQIVQQGDSLNNLNYTVSIVFPLA